MLPHSLEAESDASADCFLPGSCACVHVRVPEHLRGVIEELPMLGSFKEPSEAECSWNLPGFRERCRDVPVGVALFPGYEMHVWHLKNLNGFLKLVSTSPQNLEDQVARKRMLSGMGRGNVHMLVRKTTRKSALHILGLV
ncbi:unnamed protein product [Symbiodinium necroappetens]|uniref:Uncharacterized protein n=1 Tax=Symbiodinium necroappetens TaxID=1628268 RepID=A0A812SZS8_9DINO|nr:unnamed protein product [Symbiodinium necroappetens]